jgi:drug/metabolite transporter (DMT)-like permease
VAVIVGYFLGGEALDARIVLGAAFVLVSVVVIATSKSAEPQAVPAVTAKDAAA